jgi:hypothetical protein
MTEDEMQLIVKSMADSLQAIASTLAILVELVVKEGEKDDGPG